MVTGRSSLRFRAQGIGGLAVHHYRAAEGCALDDEAAWDAANPGLACGIKSRNYMFQRPQGSK